MPRIAILGAGISGLTCAWQLLRDNPSLDVTLFEASHRTGGIIETRSEAGFTIELGPDSWITEKPSALELVRELGLEHEILPSNDATRLTWILLRGQLAALPSNLRMMVPIGEAAVNTLAATPSPLFTPAMIAAFRRELDRAPELRSAALRRRNPAHDESIATFTRRHFGHEVLDRLAAPLLSGVLGGDVRQLSVRAVMAAFVVMEREYGSLIAALGARYQQQAAPTLPHPASLPEALPDSTEAEWRDLPLTSRTLDAQPNPVAPAPARRPSLFTTLRSGLGALPMALTAALPPGSLRLGTRVNRLSQQRQGWSVRSIATAPESHSAARHALKEEFFDTVVLALPARSLFPLLQPLDRTLASLLPRQASSAILVAFAWHHATFTPPPGFGLLVPPARSPSLRQSRLLAATFVDQKFALRAPSGGRLIRVFLGTAEAERLLQTSDRAVAALALRELQGILRERSGPLPPPALSLVGRWAHSLPQYAVGHLDRVAALEHRVSLLPGLHLLGNGLHGVGLPDLIQNARRLARALAYHKGR